MERGFRTDAGPYVEFFWEVDIGSTIVGHLDNGPAAACCAWVGLKVRNIEGTQKWEFFVDYGANGTFTQIGSSTGQDANFGQGIPMGETGRRGGTRTGAMDEHKELRRKLCGSCSYSGWSTNSASKDTLSNWHGVLINDTRYEVVKD